MSANTPLNGRGPGAAASGDSVRRRLERVLAGQLRFPLEATGLDDATPLHGRGLGLDSLDMVGLVIRVEEEFDIFLDAEEVSGGVTTFGGLLEIVTRRLADGAGGARERG